MGLPCWSCCGDWTDAGEFDCGVWYDSGGGKPAALFMVAAAMSCSGFSVRRVRWALTGFIMTVSVGCAVRCCLSAATDRS